MAVQSEHTEALDLFADSHAILERARHGTRLMTIRGAVMRGISIGANLLLLVLVSPSELGLLAVARGTFALLQYLAELGIGKALLRRSATPTQSEYAALAGLQILVGCIVITIGAFWSAPILGFGAIDRRWHYPMLATVATMLSLAYGTGARVRLERALAYERLAIVDVLNVLLLNVGLLLFALIHQFPLGVFVLLGVATVAANGLLYAWAPGPVPSLNLRPLRGIAKQSSGFLVASTCAVVREQGTAVLIGGLFGLSIAGLYSFAERVAQVLNISFDGFRNASTPAAARLAGDTRSLRALATRTLAGSASLTAPLALVAICALPILAHLVPKWSSAVLLTQWYVGAYAIYGVLAASMEPAAVAKMGARAAVTEQASALLAGWAAFVMVHFMGPAYLAAAVVIMYAAPLIALFAVMSHDVRPEISRDITLMSATFVLSVAFYAGLQQMHAPLLVSAILPPLLLVSMVPQFRSFLTRLRARWSTTRIAE